MRTLTTAAIIALGSITGTVSAAAFTDASLTYTNSFAGFAGAGFAPTPASGQLDSDDVIARGLEAAAGTLDFGGTQTTASSRYAKGGPAERPTNDGVWAADTIAGTGVNSAFGIVPGGNNFTPGDIVFRVTNDSTLDIESIRFASDLYYRSVSERQMGLSMYYSVGTSPLALSSVPGSATLVDGIVSPSTGASTNDYVLAKSVDKSLNAAVPVGQSLFVYYLLDEVSTTGVRDGLAIDNISFTATQVPEPTGLAAAALALIPFAIRRRRGA